MALKWTHFTHVTPFHYVGLRSCPPPPRQNPGCTHMRVHRYVMENWISRNVMIIGFLAVKVCWLFLTENFMKLQKHNGPGCPWCLPLEPPLSKIFSNNRISTTLYRVILFLNDIHLSIKIPFKFSVFLKSSVDSRA